MSEICFLEKSCKAEHMNAPTKVREKLVRIGTLFGGQAVCMWCGSHLEMMVKPPLVELDRENLETLRKRFPNWAKVIDETGIETVRHELGCQWLEVNPTPVLRPEPQPPNVKVFGIKQ
jgi:hypothetical protein